MLCVNTLVAGITRNCVYETLCLQPFGCPYAILLIILNQQTFKAPIYNNFQAIPSTSFQWLNLQRAIIQRNIIASFLYFSR